MRNLLLLGLITVLFSSCSSFKNNKDYVFSSSVGKQKYIKSYNAALQLWNVPFDETDVITSCGTAHVIVTGPESGEPLILFHGMDASSTMWFPNVKALSKNNRVYAIDFPLETGKSIACGNKLSNQEIAIFYNEIFDHFKMKNVNLVGASRGGWMATFLALQPDNKIKRLILLSPAQTFRGMKQPLKILSAVALKLFPSKNKLDKFFNAFSFYPEKIDPLYKEQFYLANVYGNSKPRFINMLQFTKAELGRLKIPVLVFIGDHDIVNDKKSIERAHELIPKVETVFVKDAGHFLSIDQSAIVNKKITDFLEKT